MERYHLGWVEVAIEQYLALPEQLRQLVDDRIEELLTNPAGPNTGYDPRTDLWTTTDRDGAGLITYVFHPERPRLVILRLTY